MLSKNEKYYQNIIKIKSFINVALICARSGGHAARGASFWTRALHYLCKARPIEIIHAKGVVIG